METWKPVYGFEQYEVSDHGRVRRSGRVLKCTPGTNGYPIIRLRRDGRGHSRYVHHLVLSAFVCPRPSGMYACHNDGVKTNNRVTNLRWDTQKSNMADARRHGTLKHADVCVNGHSRIDNTYASNGACITCVKSRSENRRQRNLAAGLTSRGTVRVL